MDRYLFSNLKRKLTQSVLLVILYFGLINSALAQVSVQATSGLATAAYTSISAAFTAINNGTHKGVITINITGNVTEPTAVVDLYRSGSGIAPNVSEYASVTIRPRGGNFTVTIQNTTNYKGLIQLVGADNVTIDGDDPNVPGERNLTLLLPASTGTGTAAIRIASNATNGSDGAENIQIRNLNIIGSRNSINTGTATFGIVFGNGTNSSNYYAHRNRNVQIENNYIRKVAYGIYLAGQNATYRCLDIQVKNNIIGSAHQDSIVGIGGIYLSHISNTDTAAVVSGNDIRVGLPITSSVINSYIYGISVGTGCDGLTIENNNIHDIYQPYVTISYSAAGIILNGANDLITIKNNFIRDIVASNKRVDFTSNNINSGIQVSAKVTNLSIVHNTIVLNTPNINAYSADAPSANIHIINKDVTVSHFLNNILVNRNNSINAFNIIFNNTNTAPNHPFNTTIMDNNCYYNESGRSYIMAYTGANAGMRMTSLAAWRNNYSKDLNSIVELPPFISATDLHIVNGANTRCESGGVATSVSGVFTDYDNQVRNGATPDIGADEFNGNRVYTCNSVVNPGNTIANTSNRCLYTPIRLTTQNRLNGTGWQYQWKQSNNFGGPYTDIVNAVDSFIDVRVENNVVYYKIEVMCANGGMLVESNPIAIEASNQIEYSTPNTRCGPGETILSAQANNGGTVSWFADSVGGQSLGSGNSFTTPFILNTTTFYAEPVNGRAPQVVPSPNKGYEENTYSVYAGLRFTVHQPLRIDSVTIKARHTSSTYGNVRILIRDLNDNIIAQGPVFNIAVNTSLAEYKVPVMTELIPGDYKMTMDQPTLVSYFVSEFSGLNYPYVSAGGELSITAASTGSGSSSSQSEYRYFYNWIITTNCKGPRMPVEAFVTPAAPFELSDDITVCNNTPKEISVKTGTTDFNQFTWLTVSNLFVDNAAVFPYTNSNTDKVYYKSANAGIYQVIGKAFNSSNQCQNFDTMNVIVLPNTFTTEAIIKDFCNSGRGRLRLATQDTLGDATFLWQESMDNITFTDVIGADSITFLGSLITENTFYRATVLVDGVTCDATFKSDTILIHHPEITKLDSIVSCDTARFTLIAETNGNYDVKWYDSATSANPFFIGPSYYTPYISTTRNYYAKAFKDLSDTLQVGEGNKVTNNNIQPFSRANGGIRFQYIISVEELVKARVRPGEINSIALYVNQLSTTGQVVDRTLKDFAISMGHTNNYAFNSSGFIPYADLVTVYNRDYIPTTTGWNYIGFTTPFVWDGTSNIVVELVSNSGNAVAGGNHTILYDDYPGQVGYYHYQNNVTPATSNAFRNATGGTRNFSTMRPNFRFGQIAVCEGDMTPVSITIKDKVYAVVSPKDTVGLCDNDPRILRSRDQAQDYQWFESGLPLVGQIFDTISITSPGEYTLVTHYNTCYDTSQVIVVVPSPTPVLDLGPDFDMCYLGQETITVEDTVNTIVWDDGSTDMVRKIYEAGTYYAALTNSYHCSGYDTVVVGYLPIPDPQLGADTVICKNDTIVLNPGVFTKYYWSDGSWRNTLLALDSGKYVVKVENDYGCYLSDSIYIGLLPTAETEGFNFVPYFHEKFGKFKFNVLYPRNVIAYHWDFGDGNTSTLFSPIHVYQKPGKYFVKLVVTGATCEPQTYAQEITFAADNTDVVNLENDKLTIYPNPAQNLLHIELDHNIGVKSEIKVYDVMGREYDIAYELLANRITLNTSQLVSGVYRITIKEEGRVYTSKFEILK